ncbi:MAG: hypothetical protein GY820_48120 [Gammaproteobacteria bacterium]|nr:hypothetical protein [Gammaproteobacteria bacterium]
MSCSYLKFTEPEVDVFDSPKFAIMPKKFPISDIVANVQNSLWFFPNGGDMIAASIARLIHVNLKKIKCNLAPIHKKALPQFN